MNNLEYYYNQIDVERNIYEAATLIKQNRRNIAEYIDILQDPETKTDVSHDTIEKSKADNLVRFINESNNPKWKQLNQQFLNYHKSLSVYTLINSAPIINYISLHSEIGFLKNIKVADIGGGT